MYNKEAILIPTTSICEGVRGVIAHMFEPTSWTFGLHIRKAAVRDGPLLKPYS